MFRAVVARTCREIEQLRPAWEALQAAAPATLFQSYRWNRAAAEAFAGREAPFVVFVENDSGAALIPAAVSVSPRRLTFLGDALFDYRDLLAVGDSEIQRAAWARLAELDLPLSLTALRGRQGHDAWRALAPRFFCHAPQILAAHGGGETLAARHRRLGRFWRRALRSGVELRGYDGSASSLLRCIYRQKAAQLGPCGENLFLDPLRVEFMAAVCAAESSACELFTLEKGGRLLSALVTFRDRCTRRFYTVFYDPEFAAYSPGNILLFEICRRTLDDGLDCDLMTGEQPYKRRLATSAVPLFRVEASAEAIAAAGRLPAPAGEVAA